MRIYVLFHEDVFRDVFVSFSEAMREKQPGSCCRIETRDRMEY